MSHNSNYSPGEVRGDVFCFGGGRYCINQKTPHAPKWLSTVMLSDLIGMTCRKSLAFDDHTRQDLKRDSKILARALLALGVKRGDCLLIMDNFYPCICAVYAAMRIGAIAVPFAEDATDEIIAKFVTDQRGDTFLIVNNKSADYARKICKKTAYKCKCVIDVNSGRYERKTVKLGEEYYDYREIEEVAHLGRKRLHIPWSDGSTVMMGSSSGTSGEVKFFSYTDQNIINSVLSVQVALNISLFSRNSDAWTGIVPRQRPYGLLNSVLMPSCGRRHVYLAHPEETVNDIFAKSRVICCATDFVEIVQNELTINGYDLTKDTRERPITIIIGGAYLSAEESDKFLEFLHMHGFDAKICLGYGISEAVGCVTVVNEDNYRPGTVGRLTPGIKVWLRKDDGSAYKMGDVGRLWVSGDSVIQTYGSEALDKKGVCRDDNGEVWIDTGDYMSLYQNGYLKFHYSEKDFYFAETHEKIYPRKAESAIEQMNDVERCWVLGHADRAVSVAFVAAKQGVDEKKLLKKIIETIGTIETPNHELLSELEIPRYYKIVSIDDLQIDKAGKRLNTIKTKLMQMIDFDKPDL